MNRWRTVALATITILLVLAGIVFLRRPQQGLPHDYSFLPGSMENWEAFGGTWEVANRAMENDSDERGAKLLTGSAYWGNYSLEADVKLLGPEGDAGLIVRASDEENGVDSYRGYYAGLRGKENRLTTDDNLVLGKVDHSYLELRTIHLPRGVNPLQWYHLKVLAYDCNFAASVSSPAESDQITSISTVDPNCFATGRIGLRSYAAGGAWRNVQIRPAKYADFVAMTNQRNASALPYSSDAEKHAALRLIEPHMDTHPPNPTPEPIRNLRLISDVNPPIATVRGVVVATSPTLYIQDSTGGIALPQIRNSGLRIGDEVQATGQVEPHNFSPVLRHAEIRTLWADAPLPPLSVTAAQAATGAFDATFIQVKGELKNKSKASDGASVLLLEDGKQTFQALVSGERAYLIDRGLKAGSVLSIRGICVVDAQYTHNLTPFIVLLRSTDDLDILAGPPWWSAGHLAALIVGSLVLALLAQWGHNRVERWKLRAVLDERQRLAHEVHDTLAQSFAGIGFQLQALRNELPSPTRELHQHLDLACDLVRHSHTEARRNIATLRPEYLQTLGVLASLERSAARMVGAGSIRVSASSSGETLELPLQVSDTLFRIGQEAIANAVRHSQATSIGILLQFQQNTVQLKVQDNGIGFNQNEELSGFGLRGMRERARMISAKFEVASSPGAGTTLRVCADLPPRLTLTTLPYYWMEALRRLRSNEHASRQVNPHIYRG